MLEEKREHRRSFSPVALAVMDRHESFRSNSASQPVASANSVDGLQHHLQHLPVGSNLYQTPHHHLPQQHQDHQFVFGNGDLAAMQASQYTSNANDMFGNNLAWTQQPQHPQHHQYHPIQYSTGSANTNPQHFQPNQHQYSHPSSLTNTSHPPNADASSTFPQSNSVTNWTTPFQSMSNPLVPPSTTTTAEPQADGFAHLTVEDCPNLRFLSPREINPALLGALNISFNQETMADGRVDAVFGSGREASPPAAKKQKPSPTPVSVASPALDQQPEPSPTVTAALTLPRESRTVGTAKPKLEQKHQSPAVRVKNELEKILYPDEGDEGSDDPAEIAGHAWNVIAGVEVSDMESVMAATNSILSSEDDILQAMGELHQFSGRLRKWIVAEHNKDKKSPNMVRLLRVCLPSFYSV